jgi:hypothetical protein
MPSDFFFMPPLHHHIRQWQRLRRSLLGLGPARATVLLSALAALACAGVIAPLIAWPLLRLWTDA